MIPQNIVKYLIILLSSIHCYGQLDTPIYDDMKANFLNIDSQLIGVIDLNDYYNDTTQDFPVTEGNNIAELRINEGGWGGWHTYGGTYWTTNSLHGTQSLTRLATGGAPRNNAPICGTSVDNSYDTAVSCTTCWCGEGNEQWEDFSGSRIWIGAGSNTTFVQSFFPNMSDKPANRMCIEIELPVDRLNAFPHPDGNGSTVEYYYSQLAAFHVPNEYGERESRIRNMSATYHEDNQIAWVGFNSDKRISTGSFEARISNTSFHINGWENTALESIGVWEDTGTSA